MHEPWQSFTTSTQLFSALLPTGRVVLRQSVIEPLQRYITLKLQKFVRKRDIISFASKIAPLPLLPSWKILDQNTQRWSLCHHQTMVKMQSVTSTNGKDWH